MDYVESFAAHGEALDVYGAFSGKLEEAQIHDGPASDAALARESRRSRSPSAQMHDGPGKVARTGECAAHRPVFPPPPERACLN